MTHIEALNFDFAKFKLGEIAKNSAKPKFLTFSNHQN